MVAEGAMIGVATEAEAGTVGASEGPGVVGTEVALARWVTPQTGMQGKAMLACPLRFCNSFSSVPVLPSLFCNLPTPDHTRVFCVGLCNCDHISGSH